MFGSRHRLTPPQLPDCLSAPLCRTIRQRICLRRRGVLVLWRPPCRCCFIGVYVRCNSRGAPYAGERPVRKGACGANWCDEGLSAESCGMPRLDGCYATYTTIRDLTATSFMDPLSLLDTCFGPVQPRQLFMGVTTGSVLTPGRATFVLNAALGDYQWAPTQV